MLQILRSSKNRMYGIVHAVEIGLGFLGILLGSLQLYSRNKLHGLGNLLGTLDTALTPLYVSH